ncbi:MAG: glucose 1-dehydrogenase [Pacificimonas sp.]
MADRLKGKVAFVSGASSGLGASAARALAREGAMVAVGARREDRLASLVEEVEDEGGRALAVGCDVTDGGSVERAFDTIATAHGHIDILVNSAGIGEAIALVDTDEAAFDRHFDVNVKGLWRTSRTFSRAAIANGHGGSIVNIASMLALGAHPGQTLYCGTKGAVLQMTRAMAIELQSKGIRVNAVCPGYFSSEMTQGFEGSDAGASYIKRTPAKRFADPSELDGAIIYLASDEASFTTGAHLSVDGGHQARLV